MGEEADLWADYRRAGFGAALEPGERIALIVVDLVMAYLDPASPLFLDGEAALASTVRLARAARAAGAPVVFTSVSYAAGGLDGGVFFRKAPVLRVFEAGSPLGRFDPRLTPRPDDLVIVKQYPSAFFGTTLASTLRAQRIDTVLIAGFSTSGCVRATALDALQHGFAPFVVRDACADRQPGPHAANLFDIQAKIGEVIDEAQALSQFGVSAAPLDEIDVAAP